MKKILTTITTLAILSAAPLLWAQEHGEHHGAEMKMAQHGAEKKMTQVEGRIIGLTCYVKHDTQGEKHKTCAKQCAEKGLPLGLLTDDGKLYQIAGKGHEELKTVNAPLLKYIESKVLAQGEAFEKHGQRMIVIEKIKAL